jgi:hypothetical protein
MNKIYTTGTKVSKNNQDFLIVNSNTTCEDLPWTEERIHPT